MKIFAHRGDSGRFPENTKEAFESAVKMGVDVIETDIHISKDKQLVISHDDVLERVSNGSGKIAEKTLAELKELDKGYWFKKEEAYPLRAKGITFLSFEEMLTSFPDTQFNIDLKDESEELVRGFVDLVKKYNAIDSLTVGCFHHSNLVLLRSLLPEMRTSLSPKEVKKLFILHKTGLLIFKTHFPAKIFQVPEVDSGTTIITPRFIRCFQKRGFEIQVWTINEEADMRRLIDWGVDAIMTDFPEKLLTIHKEFS